MNFFLISSWINSNMRCIEIHKDGDEVQVDEKINSNMRCIEMRYSPYAVLQKIR